MCRELTIEEFSALGMITITGAVSIRLLEYSKSRNKIRKDGFMGRNLECHIDSVAYGDGEWSILAANRDVLAWMADNPDLAKFVQLYTGSMPKLSVKEEKRLKKYPYVYCNGTF